MLARTTLLAATTLRRAISAVMCALMLLSVAISTDAGASAVSAASSGQVGFVLLNGGAGDASVPLDALPCHSAHHLCCKVTPLPPILAAGVPAIVHPDSGPDAAPDRVLLSGVTELPARPPRA